MIICVNVTHMERKESSLRQSRVYSAGQDPFCTATKTVQHLGMVVAPVRGALQACDTFNLMFWAAGKLIGLLS